MDVRRGPVGRGRSVTVRDVLTPDAPGRRTLAPFGRRLLEVRANRELGAYRLIEAFDSEGPGDPRPGQFYMLAAADSWGGHDGRPYLPRAFSFARASPAGGATVLG